MGNVFSRAAYSSVAQDALVDKSLYQEQDYTKQIFSGGDMTVFINNIKVGNLESVTYSSSVEVNGQFAFGRRDALQYTQGKRVIVGSMMFAQFNQHALLEEVFQLSRRNIRAQKDMWDPDAPATRIRSRQPLTLNTSATTGTLSERSLSSATGPNGNSAYDQSGNLRGLSMADFSAQLDYQTRIAADELGAVKIDYADQLPPFDLTLIGVSRSGTCARATLFGITINQETAGFSMQDLGNSAGFSFVALHVSPWRAVDGGVVVNNVGKLRMPA